MQDARPRSRCARTRSGLTLIELMIGLGIIGAMLLLASSSMRSYFDNQRVRSAARSVADLMLVARAEAIRTRDNHVVLVRLDAADNPLLDASGRAVAALLIRDLNADGAPQVGEYVAAVPFDQTGGLAWGAHADVTGAAPNDTPPAFPPADTEFACCTFTQPNGADEARWVAFLPDGTPRAYSVGPFAAGPVGSGGGGVYVTNGSRTYAVVLAALGGVRVHAWNDDAGNWRD